MPKKDHYLTLGLEESATQKEVEEKYHALCNEFKKDTANTDVSLFKKRLEAYLVLSNVEERKKYDASDKIQSWKEAQTAQNTVNLSIAAPSPKPTPEKKNDDAAKNTLQLKLKKDATLEQVKKQIGNYLQKKLGLTMQQAEKLGYKMQLKNTLGMRPQLTMTAPGVTALNALKLQLQKKGLISTLLAKIVPQSIKPFCFLPTLPLAPATAHITKPTAPTRNKFCKTKMI